MAVALKAQYNAEQLNNGDFVLVKHDYNYPGTQSIIIPAIHIEGKCYTGRFKHNPPLCVRNEGVPKTDFINKVTNVICKIEKDKIPAADIAGIEFNLKAQDLDKYIYSIVNDDNYHEENTPVTVQYGKGAENGSYVLCSCNAFGQTMAYPAYVYNGRCYGGKRARHDRFELVNIESESDLVYALDSKNALYVVDRDSIKQEDLEAIWLRLRFLNINY